MTALAPLKFTLYDPETLEVHGEYICNFVPLGYLELAIRLSKSKVNINIDTLAGLITDLFGNKFSIDELLKYSDQNDRMMILQAVIMRARNLMAKPSEIKIKSEITDEPEPELEDEDWIIDLKISLVKAFNWCLNDIDATYIESLLPFVSRFAGTYTKTKVNNKKYCDQVPGW